MRPPFEIELWSADGNSQLLNVTMSVDAAQRVYQEAAAKLNVGEIVRVRDAFGTLIFSTNPAELGIGNR